MALLFPVLFWGCSRLGVGVYGLMIPLFSRSVEAYPSAWAWKSNVKCLNRDFEWFVCHRKAFEVSAKATFLSNEALKSKLETCRPVEKVSLVHLKARRQQIHASSPCFRAQVGPRGSRANHHTSAGL